MWRSGDRMASATAAALFLLILSLFSSSLPFCSAALNNLHQQQQQPWTVKKVAPPKPQPPSGVDLGKTASTVFPLAGNVHPDGIYYVILNIGNPPKPYFLDVDTGSDLTWLQCDAPCVRCSKCPHPLYKPTKNQLIPCKDPICVALHSNGAPQDNRCALPTDQCDYEIEYADRGSSLGVLIADAFYLRFTNGSITRPNLAFGCGYNQQGGGTTSMTDGVLGLGLGKSGILSQLRDRGLIRSVIGHCLSRNGGGFLFLGDSLVPRSGMTWTTMSTSGFRRYYSPGPASLFLGKQPLAARDFQVVFDSGSSYTYFANRYYETFLTTLAKDLNGKPLKAAPEDRTLPKCWKGNKPFRSIADFKKYFNSLVLSFGNGKRTLLEIPPEGYLITTKSGNACLGILNGTQAGLNDLNVIGDISMQDYLVVYDNERDQIGWARANCDVKLNTDSDDGVNGGLYRPHSTYTGILTEEWPSTCYTSII